MNKTLARFMAKVEKVASGCWVWTASKDRHGYGEFSMNGKNLKAHRASLLLQGQTLEPGVVVDHKCRNRACVNPDHLRLVDSRTNLFENSASFAYLNSIKTKCPKGHEYAGENLIIKRGRRQCRECNRHADRQRKAGL